PACAVSCAKRSSCARCASTNSCHCTRSSGGYPPTACSAKQPTVTPSAAISLASMISASTLERTAPTVGLVAPRPIFTRRTAQPPRWRSGARGGVPCGVLDLALERLHAEEADEPHDAANDGEGSNDPHQCGERDAGVHEREHAGDQREHAPHHGPS